MSCDAAYNDDDRNLYTNEENLFGDMHATNEFQAPESRQITVRQRASPAMREKEGGRRML